MILRALIAALGVCAVALAAQTLRLDRAQDALQALQQSIATAEQQSQLRAATTAEEAVSSYVENQERDAPVVERVVTRTLRVCDASGGVSMPGAAGDAGPASSKAQDDADRAAWLSAVADDLETCQSELSRLDAIRLFHNRNVGPAR